MFKHDIIKKPEVVICCNTRKKAKKFLSWAKSQGYCWIDGESFNNLKYDYYLNHTCYQVDGGCFCSKSWYKTHGFTVINYEDVLL